VKNQKYLLVTFNVINVITDIIEFDSIRAPYKETGILKCSCGTELINGLYIVTY
jgi:hypothetical protein